MSNLSENEGLTLTTRLEGSIVVLEPLTEDHAEGLWEAAQALEIWGWLPHVGESREYFDRWLRLTLTATRAGDEGPFATRDRRSGRLVGSSRYQRAPRPRRRDRLNLA
jgi:N-acetyltransferase